MFTWLTTLFQWIMAIVEILKFLPTIIALVKQIVDAIDGKDDDVKPAKAVAREQKKALRRAIKNAKRPGGQTEMLALMNVHLRRRK